MLLLIAAILSLSIPANAVGLNELIFNGKELSISVKTIAVNDIEMISLNSIATLIGINTPINPKSKSINLKNSEIDLIVTPESNYISINGNEVDMGIKPAVVNNVVYLPVDMIDVAFGGLVSWDQEAKKISATVNTETSDDSATNNTVQKKSGKISYNISKSGFTGNLVLVNKTHMVSNSYIPTNLTSVLDKNRKYLIPCKNSSVKLDKLALDAAINMFRAANSEGIKNLVVSNGYRSYGLQSTLHYRKINAYKKIYRSKEAVEKASSIVAPPGTSEHQTGLAMDVTSKAMLRTSEPLSEALSSTPEGKWLYNNSWKFGYVIRYQADKTKITGIISEPWHIRYVGLPHAEYMYKNKLCLEEYLEHIRNKGYIRFKASDGSNYEIFYLNVPASVETLTLTYSGTEKFDISSYGKNGFVITKKL